MEWQEKNSYCEETQPFPRELPAPTNIVTGGNNLKAVLTVSSIRDYQEGHQLSLGSCRVAPVIERNQGMLKIIDCLSVLTLLILKVEFPSPSSTFHRQAQSTEALNVTKTYFTFKPLTKKYETSYLFRV